MRNKTFKIPYITEADKEFLMFEYNAYKDILKFLRRIDVQYEKVLERIEDKIQEYDDSQYSDICDETGIGITTVLLKAHTLFIEDVCRYFAKTRNIKELDRIFTIEDLDEEIYVLTIDYVFDNYVRKYLEETQDEK